MFDYLVFPVTSTAVPRTQGLPDIVDANQVVLIPAGAAELVPTFVAVDGPFMLTAFHADESGTGLIAFDTRAKSGMLPLRDDAGDVMIAWSVGATS